MYLFDLTRLLRVGTLVEKAEYHPQTCLAILPNGFWCLIMQIAFLRYGGFIDPGQERQRAAQYDYLLDKQEFMAEAH
jgi:hypothetical protein